MAFQIIRPVSACHQLLNLVHISLGCNKKELLYAGSNFTTSLGLGPTSCQLNIKTHLVPVNLRLIHPESQTRIQRRYIVLESLGPHHLTNVCGQ